MSDTFELVQNPDVRLERHGSAYIQVLAHNGKHNTEERNCFDCHHMQAHVTWWCKSVEAFKFYGTRDPGRAQCDFWKPCKQATPPGPDTIFTRFMDWLCG